MTVIFDHYVNGMQAGSHKLTLNKELHDITNFSPIIQTQCLCAVPLYNSFLLLFFFILPLSSTNTLLLCNSFMNY